MMKKTILFLFQLWCLHFLGAGLIAQTSERANFTDLVSDRLLYDYVDVLSADEFEGRLTGQAGYDKAAQWVIEKFKEYGVKPLGYEGSYLQQFPHPYTEIFPGSKLLMHPAEGDSKQYEYVEEFIPGSTSGDGEVTAEVIYVGYGITAPELGYDDYADVDVTGKIVLMEREVPPNTNDENFLAWRPYSFHQYKLRNAVQHGAAGMMYNYLIANPNNDWSEGFVYSHVGESVMKDVFSQTGEQPDSIVREIRETLQPHSFNTGKTFTIINKTRHHPDGTGSNVIGYIEGSDPVLKNEYIFVGGHLDHLGRCYEIMPGANDNASAVAVTLGIAKALTQSGTTLKRSVVFILPGAEEAALKGVQYFLKHPTVPSLDDIVGYINMDAVGIGNNYGVGFARNYPDLYAYLEEANAGLELAIIGRNTPNLGRPRLDAAFFDWYGIPVLSIGTYEETPSSNYRYHTPYDNISNIEPEVMFNLSELLFRAIMMMANDEQLDIERGDVREAFIQ